mgnify:CR=1 FL=1
MKKVNKKVLKVVEHVMRNEAVYGIDRFPPACMGIFHQPKRPLPMLSGIQLIVLLFLIRSSLTAVILMNHVSLA